MKKIFSSFVIGASTLLLVSCANAEMETTPETISETTTSIENNQVEESEGEKAMKRFMQISWEEIEARNLTFQENQIGTTNDIMCIGAIPDYDIKIYGYNDEEIQGCGVAIQIKDHVSYFDWVYSTPRCLDLKIYWNEEAKQLQVALPIYTGTGVAASELHVLQQEESGKLQDSVFPLNDYGQQLQELITYKYDDSVKTLWIYDAEQDNILSENKMPSDVTNIKALSLGDISNFSLGDEIHLEVPIGYVSTGQIAEYEGMPFLDVKVVVSTNGKEMTYQLEEPSAGETYWGIMYGQDPESNTQLTQNQAFGKVLWDLHEKGCLPDGTQWDYHEMDDTSTNNQFALIDIDDDGAEEMIVQLVDSCMAGMCEIVYGFQNGEVYQEACFFPSVTYYDNGIVVEDWSHNQGLAGDFWPYFIHKYLPEEDTFAFEGGVDAWDRKLSEENYEGEPFAANLDVDGDGILYYILPADWQGEENMPMVDGAAYETWRDSYIHDAKKVDVTYQRLTEENIDKLGYQKPEVVEGQPLG